MAQQNGTRATFDKLSSTVIEFAGVKFTAVANTGLHNFVTPRTVSYDILRSLKFGRDVKETVVVDEKYSFTPDLMKAATKARREPNTTTASIRHLRYLTN